MTHRKFMSAEDLLKLTDLLCGSWARVWPEVRGVWVRADAVYTGLTFPVTTVRSTLEFSLAAELLPKFPAGRASVVESLLDADPKVAGYCLVALECVSPVDPAELPPRFLDRQEIVTFHSGCLRGEMCLSEFAKRLLDRTDHAAERTDAELAWAGRERACPRCGTRFSSVQNLGACPSCRTTFRASEVGS